MSVDKELVTVSILITETLSVDRVTVIGTENDSRLWAFDHMFNMALTG